MAPDGRYYIRAGRHTEFATQFIVEALWAKRHFAKPRLTYLIRQDPNNTETIQIGLVALTDSPAIDIELTMEPLPGLYAQGCREFPVRIGVIDRNSPFFFDVSTREQTRQHPDDTFVLKLTYHDLASNSYPCQWEINLFRALPSLRFFRKGLNEIAETLESIGRTICNDVRPPLPND